MSESTLSQIQAVAADWLRMPLAQVQAARTLEDLEIDSLGLIDLIIEVESALQLNIPDKALRGIDTLDDLVSTVDALRNGSWQERVPEPVPGHA